MVVEMASTCHENIGNLKRHPTQKRQGQQTSRTPIGEEETKNDEDDGQVFEMEGSIDSVHLSNLSSCCCYCCGCYCWFVVVVLGGSSSSCECYPYCDCDCGCSLGL